MYCFQNNELVLKMSAASTMYFEACSALMQLPAKSAPQQFYDAHHRCDLCKDACQHAKDAVLQHREAHGC